jgi:ATP-dependent DNA ligase
VIEKLVQNADPKPSVAEALAGHDSVVEPKFDGWRVIFKVEANPDGDNPDEAPLRTRAWTRKGTELTGAMPAIEAELARVLPSGSCVDGEVVVFKNVNGMAVPAGSSAVGKILGSGTAKAALLSKDLTLVAFDLLSHGDIDARPLPFGKRRAALEAIFEKGCFAPCVQLAPQLEATDENHDALLAAGYEGSMVKWLDAPYRSGYRGWGWWKLKGVADVDVVVMGYKPGEKGWVGMVGAVVFGQFTEDGLLVERGRCSGLKMDERVTISQNPDAYLGKVFSMRHMGVFPPSEEHPHGAFRHPQFKTWRPDKAMEAVTLHDE